MSIKICDYLLDTGMNESATTCGSDPELKPYLITFACFLTAIGFDNKTVVLWHILSISPHDGDKRKKNVSTGGFLLFIGAFSQ
jgi:hypothetical protein